MKSKEAWILTWEKHIAGGFLFGSCSERTEGTLERASNALRIKEEVRSLLSRMFDDGAFLETPLPTRNGVNTNKTAGPLAKGPG